MIRKKAQDILNLMNDNDLYQMEREKARKLKASLTSVTRDEYGGSYTTQTYQDDYRGGYDSGPRGGYDSGSRGGYGSGSRGFDDGYGARRSQPRAPAPADDEYYSDDEQPPKPSAPQQGKFNPFQDRPAAPVQQPVPPQQQAFNEFMSQPQQQAFNEFMSQPQQQAFNPFMSQPQQQPQQQAFNPFAQQPMQQQPVQPAFNPFAQARQQQQVQQPQASNLTDLMSLGAPAQQPISADDLLFGTPAPQPAQPMPMQPMQAQPAPMDNFIDLSGPAPAPAPMQSQPAQQPKKAGGMLDEFGDLVNLNLRGNEERRYGAAGMQQRGAGQTLGGGWQ